MAEVVEGEEDEDVLGDWVYVFDSLVGRDEELVELVVDFCIVELVFDEVVDEVEAVGGLLEEVWLVGEGLLVVGDGLEEELDVLGLDGVVLGDHVVELGAGLVEEVRELRREGEVGDLVH